MHWARENQIGAVGFQIALKESDVLHSVEPVRIDAKLMGDDEAKSALEVALLGMDKKSEASDWST